ncbi:MAG: HEAT repeat domain-containing protein [Candidatus Aminicenantes bacterium]|nr:HEAT repeat domain-containing protein [Candidatus Aminicenantes bacterium]
MKNRKENGLHGDKNNLWRRADRISGQKGEIENRNGENQAHYFSTVETSTEARKKEMRFSVFNSNLKGNEKMGKDSRGEKDEASREKMGKSGFSDVLKAAGHFKTKREANFRFPFQSLRSGPPILSQLLIALMFMAISVLASSQTPVLAVNLAGAAQSAADDLTKLDLVLTELAQFDHSKGEAPALELERIISHLKDNPTLRAEAEKKMIQFFVGKASRNGLIAVSKPLSWIAGLESVNALAPCLLDPEKSDPARYVMERIPGEEADRALIEALEKAPAELLPGIISSLGQRRVKAAVLPLGKLLQKNPAPPVISAALEAMGNIGENEAISILSKYLKASNEALRVKSVDALLRIASRNVNDKNFGQAQAISEILLRAKLTQEEKMAAWRVKILSAKDGGKTQLHEALKSKDEPAKKAALLLLPEIVSEEEIASYLPLLSGGSENFQIQAAAVLAHYPVSVVREFLVDLATKSSLVEIRAEALVSLGKTGDSSVVEFLVRKAAAARGREKEAARESLVALRGKSVDAKILELLEASPSPDVRHELLLAACARNIGESREYFLKEAANPSADMALVSRGLRAFGDISLAEELLAVAFKTEDDAFREELAGIMAAWAKASARPDARSVYFRNLLGKETDSARQALLITIIGKIGERNSLPLLRNYANSQDQLIREAAIRALADWPEAEARDDLLTIARVSSNLKEKVLAIRGLVRLTASERYRQPEAVVESLKMIYALCPRAEEKKLVLSAFPDFACKPALDFCQSLASDPEVGPEAHTAIEKIAQRIKRGT